MTGWAHEQASALLEHRVEAGDISTATERRVRDRLADGRTGEALRILVE